VIVLVQITLVIDVKPGLMIVSVMIVKTVVHVLMVLIPSPVIVMQLILKVINVKHVLMIVSVMTV
jgi:hypothetical protein